MSLNLTPNELVGYRILPDWHSFNVVLVKRHGPNSKNAGQEYFTPLAYCKNLDFAVSWIVSHAARMEGELNQKDALQAEGSVADAKALLAAFEKAQAYAIAAAKELQASFEALAMTQKELVMSLGAKDAGHSDSDT
jgi:hypothetical protein